MQSARARPFSSRAVTVLDWYSPCGNSWVRPRDHEAGLTDGLEIMLTRKTQPKPELPVQQITLAPQPPPKIAVAQDVSAILLWYRPRRLSPCESML
jgi:hypothetical protein